MKTKQTSPQRGQATKQSLIDTAIEIFGRDGFHASSTREIARQAGVNQALIGYHFGGKENLYLAAMEYIAQRIRKRLIPVVREIEEELNLIQKETSCEDKTARATYLELLLRLSENFVSMLIDEESSSWARMILREQQSPTPAFDVLYDSIMQKLLDLATRLAAKIRGIDAFSEQARLLTLSIFGQIVIYRVSRAAVMRHMGWTAYGEKESDLIRQQVRQSVTTLLLRGDLS